MSDPKPVCADCGAEVPDGVDREYWCDCGRQFDREIEAAWHEDHTGHRTHRMEVV